MAHDSSRPVALTRALRSRRAWLLVAVLSSAAWIVPPPAYDSSSSPPLACRGSVSPSASSVRWIDAVDAEDRTVAARWCRAVGAPVHVQAVTRRVAARGEPIAVVSWNVNVGAGDLEGLLSEIRAGKFSEGAPVQHVVLLLQEVLRRGPAVPPPGPGQHGARRLVRGAQPFEIVSFARGAGLSLFYVPSMRNGRGPSAEAEDRGNAILSTFPLADLRAVELPLERQRRVAVMATLVGAGPGVPVTVASVHLEPFVSAKRLWFFGAASARGRQARALVAALPPDGPVLVGGDFNTWSGSDEPALREMRRLGGVTVAPSAPTFANGRVLDHLFLRVPPTWRGSHQRADRPYGSDHFPLVGFVTVG